MPRRNISEDKAKKSALIAQLAARHGNQHTVATVANMRSSRAVIMDDDSSDDEFHSADEDQNSSSSSGDSQSFQSAKDGSTGDNATANLTEDSASSISSRRDDTNVTKDNNHPNCDESDSDHRKPRHRLKPKHATATRGEDSDFESLLDRMGNLEVGDPKKSNSGKIERHSSTATGTAEEAGSHAASATSGDTSKAPGTLKNPDSCTTDISQAAESTTAWSQAGPLRPTHAPEAADLVLGEGEYRLCGAIANKLYPHQVEGVRWLWSLHKMGRGGILGDDMVGGLTSTGAQLAAMLAESVIIYRCHNL